MGFSQKVVVFNNSVETNAIAGFFEAIKIPFTIALNNDQKIKFARVFAKISKREGGSPSAKAEVFFNNVKKGEKFWDISDLIPNEPFTLDKPISLANFRVNEPNEVIVEVEQGIIGNTVWDIYVDVFYELEGDDPPPDEPVIDAPEHSEESFFGDFDLTKVALAVLAIGGGLIFINSFGRGLGGSVGRR